MISNICRANFNGGRTAQGNNRYQWDYGQILEISGIENLPDPFVAQFSNTPVLGTAKTTVGTGGRVEIPNEYFLSGQNVYCFIVLHTDEDDGRTVYIATIPVTKRPKPIDDPITPTQQSTIDTAIAALQAGVAKAEGFADDAEEQAGIAQNAANTASQAADKAEQSAGQSGYMYFYIDENGHLIYTHTSNVDVDFILENGHLYVESVA